MGHGSRLTETEWTVIASGVEGNLNILVEVSWLGYGEAEAPRKLLGPGFVDQLCIFNA
jgi:hypothetical protein